MDNKLLMMSMLALCFFTMAAIVTLEWVHPGDNTATIVSLLGILAPFSGVLLTLMLRTTHTEQNTHLQEIITLSKTLAHQEGREEQRQEQLKENRVI